MYLGQVLGKTSKRRVYVDLRKVFDGEPEVHKLCTGKIQARKCLIFDACRWLLSIIVLWGLVVYGLSMLKSLKKNLVEVVLDFLKAVEEFAVALYRFQKVQSATSVLRLCVCHSVSAAEEDNVSGWSAPRVRLRNRKHSCISFMVSAFRSCTFQVGATLAMLLSVSGCSSFSILLVVSITPTSSPSASWTRISVRVYCISVH